MTFPDFFFFFFFFSWFFFFFSFFFFVSFFFFLAPSPLTLEARRPDRVIWNLSDLRWFSSFLLLRLSPIFPFLVLIPLRMRGAISPASYLGPSVVNTSLGEMRWSLMRIGSGDFPPLLPFLHPPRPLIPSYCSQVSPLIRFLMRDPTSTMLFALSCRSFPRSREVFL